MRLALVIALSPDRRSGHVVGGPFPADQAIALVKESIACNVALEGFPILGAFSLDSCLRQHRFKADAQSIPVVTESQSLDSVSNQIPVEIGEGDEKVVVNVATAEEASFLQALALSHAKACKALAESVRTSSEFQSRVLDLELALQRESEQRAAQSETEAKSKKPK